MRSYRNLVGGRTVSADFSAEFSPTARFHVWAIYSHLGRLGDVADFVEKDLACVASALDILLS